MAIDSSHEIATTRFWQVEPHAFAFFRDRVQRNFDMRAEFTPADKSHVMPYLMRASDRFQEKTYVGDARYVEWCNNLEPEDSIINVCQVIGVIMRSGNACSYGSKEMRDRLIEASDSPYVAGHIMYLNTPGGSSEAKYDFEYAFNHIRSKKDKKQPIIALVDSKADSAGMAIAAMCDEIHFVNVNDLVGSVGTFSAGYTQKDGDENATSKERYFEVYGSYCPDKNKSYRNIANGDYTELQSEVNDINMEFVDLVRKYRPQATEDQLTGKEYKCGDVIGTLVDRQSTLAQTAERIMELAGLSMPQGDNSLSAPPSPNNNNGDDDDACSPKKKKDYSSSSRPNKITYQSNNQSAMKEYPKIQSALGIEALVAGRDQSVYLDKSLAEQLESTLEEQQQWKTALDAKIQEIQQLNESLSKLRKDSSDQLASLTESHAAAIALLKDTHSGELATINTTHATALTDVNALLIAANTTIEEQKGTIAELAAGPGAGEQVTGNPQDNNGAQATTNDPCVCKEDMTLIERANAIDKRERELQRIAR